MILILVTADSETGSATSQYATFGGHSGNFHNESTFRHQTWMLSARSRITCSGRWTGLTWSSNCQLRAEDQEVRDHETELKEAKREVVGLTERVQMYKEQLEKLRASAECRNSGTSCWLRLYRRHNTCMELEEVRAELTFVQAKLRRVEQPGGPAKTLRVEAPISLQQCSNLAHDVDWLQNTQMKPG